MEWDKLISTKRLGKVDQTKSSGDYRSPFESDVDRVIFSNSFRRLSGKTQVHPFSKNDHVHNRLTHSLEVASVGRSLGRTLGEKIQEEGLDDLPENISSIDIGNIVKAACLAHDIGNPPFGHAGESAISQWFDSEGEEYIRHLSDDYKQDLKYFEGNAQGFRILTSTENNLWEGGLKLTYSTLAAFMKYPIISRGLSNKGKFGVFISEEEIIKKITDELGLVKKNENKWCRHPLAYLSEAADDICYATIDLEDAVELSLIDYKDVKEILFSCLHDSRKEEVEKKLKGSGSYRVNLSKIRGPLFEVLINAAIEAFLENYDTIMRGEFTSDLFSSYEPNNEFRNVIKKAKEVGREKIYTEKFKSNVELGCFSTLSCLLEAFCTAALEQTKHIENEEQYKVSWRSNLVLNELGNHKPDLENAPYDGKWNEYLCYRRVLDYVSGMTDSYASNFAKYVRGIV